MNALMWSKHIDCISDDTFFISLSLQLSWQNIMLWYGYMSCRRRKKKPNLRVKL